MEVRTWREGLLLRDDGRLLASPLDSPAIVLRRGLPADMGRVSDVVIVLGALGVRVIEGVIVVCDGGVLVD